MVFLSDLKSCVIGSIKKKSHFFCCHSYNAMSCKCPWDCYTHYNFSYTAVSNKLLWQQREKNPWNRYLSNHIRLCVSDLWCTGSLCFLLVGRAEAASRACASRFSEKICSPALVLLTWCVQGLGTLCSPTCAREHKIFCILIIQFSFFDSELWVI